MAKLIHLYLFPICGKKVASIGPSVVAMLLHVYMLHPHSETTHLKCRAAIRTDVNPDRVGACSTQKFNLL